MVLFIDFGKRLIFFFDSIGLQHSIAPINKISMFWYFLISLEIYISIGTLGIGTLLISLLLATLYSFNCSTLSNRRMWSLDSSGIYTLWITLSFSDSKPNSSTFFLEQIYSWNQVYLRGNTCAFTMVLHRIYNWSATDSWTPQGSFVWYICYALSRFRDKQPSFFFIVMALQLWSCLLKLLRCSWFV